MEQNNITNKRSKIFEVIMKLYNDWANMKLYKDWSQFEALQKITFSFITNAGKIADSSSKEKWGETSLQPCFQMKLMKN